MQTQPLPNVYGPTDLPEVTELSEEDGLRQWNLAKALQDAAQPKEQS